MQGIVEFHVTQTEQPKLCLNLRQCGMFVVLVDAAVERVTLNGNDVEYEYSDSFVSLENEAQSVHFTAAYREQFESFLEEGDAGELVIEVPQEYRKQPQTKITIPIPAFGADAGQKDEDSDMEVDPVPVQPQIEEANLVFAVHYTLKLPRSGVYFSHPNLLPQMYTSNQAGAARMWMPCLDNFKEKPTWELNVIVPRFVADCIDSQDHSSFSTEDLGREMIVVASGDLIGQYLLPGNNKKHFKYELNTPVAACSILLCVGPFEVHRIPNWEPKQQQQQQEEEEQMAIDQAVPLEPQAQPSQGGYAFCLPRKGAHLSNTIYGMFQTMEHIQKYTGVSFPFSSFKVVFVQDPYAPSVVGAGIAIFASYLLVPQDVIDQMIETKRLLVQAIAAQWAGHSLSPKSWVDVWLIVGLANFLANNALANLFGSNEVKYRVKRAMLRVCELDTTQPPLYTGPVGDWMKMLSGSDSFYEMLKKNELSTDPLISQKYLPQDEPSTRSEFVELKSWLVFHMLNKRLGKGNLQKTVGKIMVSVLSGDLSVISTNHFFKTARKVSGKSDLRNFMDQWVYGSGCPKFEFSYEFNSRKMVVEVKFKQLSTSQSNERVTPLFTGPLTIRLNEPMGTFDTEILIEDFVKVFEIPYHTKYKRARKRNPRKLKKEDMIDDSTKAQDIEDLLEGEEDEDLKISIEWIRVDPDNDWLALKSFDQADYMWASLLEKEKDVIAQFEAVEALSRFPGDSTCTTLTDVVKDNRYFYRIRMDAVLAIAEFGTEQEWFGLNQLIMLFQEMFCTSATSTIPKCNNFEVLQTYYLQKIFPLALSRIKMNEGICPQETRSLLLDLIKYNENTGNVFSDNYYVSCLIEALGDSFVKKSTKPLLEPEVKTFKAVEKMLMDDNIVEEFNFVFQPEEMDMDMAAVFESVQDKELFEESLKEVERIRVLDIIVSSYHNTVTVSCLKTLMKWMAAELIPIDLMLFHSYTRMAAFEALLLVDGIFNEPVLQYIVDTIAHDPIPYMRYYLAKILAEYAFVATTRSDESAASKVQGRWLDAKRMFGTWQGVKDVLWKILTSGCYEKRVQVLILKFCELSFETRTADSLASKVRLKLLPSAIEADDSSDDEGLEAIPLTNKVTLTHPEVVIPSLPPRKTKQWPQFPEPSSARVFEQIAVYIFDRISTHQLCVPFLQPVDEAIAPGYYSIIKHPMDVATIRGKLAAKEYQINLNALLDDFRQIFENCYFYNLESSPIVQQAARLEDFIVNDLLSFAMEKMKRAEEVPQTQQVQIPGESMESVQQPQEDTAVQQDTVPLPSSNLGISVAKLEPEVEKRCKSVLHKLASHRLGVWFRAPVDPIAQGIPHYFDIIKRPMDISTARKKLEAKLYETVAEFEEDVGLIFSNAMKFNPPESPVYKDAVGLKAFFDREWFGIVPEPSPPKPRKVSASPAKPMVSDTQASVTSPTPVPQSKPEPVNSIPVIGAPLPPGATHVLLKPPRKVKEFPEFPKPSSERIFNKISNFILSRFANHHLAAPFLRPVDESFAPGYFLIIKKPMDVSTIEKKLKERGAYNLDLNAMLNDIKQIFENCYIYNDKTSKIVAQSGRLEDYVIKDLLPAALDKMKQQEALASSEKEFDELLMDEDEEGNNKEKQKEEPKEAQFELSYQKIASPVEKKCKVLLHKLVTHRIGVWFKNPVDPIAQGIPQYFDIIKQPMDLSKIKRKLDAQFYESVAEFEDDIYLMFNNATTFNPPNTHVHQETLVLKAYFEQEWFGAVRSNRPSSSATDFPVAQPAASIQPASEAQPKPAEPLKIKLKIKMKPPKQ